MTDPELIDRLRAISLDYPEWMNQADSTGVAKFLGLVKRAAVIRSKRPAYDRGAQAERWRRAARSAIEGMEALEFRVREGIGHEF